jgi:hypothetical protein
VKAVVALLAAVWAAANLVLSYFMVAGAFVAKTAAKEGPLAQLSLLVGGVLIAGFAVAVVWQCVRMFIASGSANAGGSPT